MDEFDLEIDEVQSSTAAEPADDGVRFEVVMDAEEESGASPTGEAGGEPSATRAAVSPSATPAIDPQELAERLRQLETRVAPPPMARQQQLPDLQALGQRLASDEATVDDIVRYIQGNNQVLQHYFDARSAAAQSTEKARGEFSAQVMGDGLDYDTLNARYIDPLLSTNPAIEQVINLAAPEDPARGRMVLAAMMKVLDETRGDPINGLKTILGRLDGKQAGAKEVKDKIVAAASRRADRTLTPGSRQVETRRMDASAMRGASESDLIRLTEQMGHSV